MRKKVAGKTIMVVDDDQEFLEELADFLRANSYKPVAINMVSQALEAAASVKPDLILLDLKMPSKSGFQLASEIRSLPGFSKIPIFAMSAFVKNEATAFLAIFGIDKYIKKPFCPTQLAEEIEKTLLTKEV